MRIVVGIVSVVALAFTTTPGRADGIRAADGDGSGAAPASGDSSAASDPNGTYYNDDESPEAAAEARREFAEKMAKVRARAREMQGIKDDNGGGNNDQNQWVDQGANRDDKNRDRVESVDPWDGGGPLGAGVQRLSPFRGGLNPPPGEVAAIDYDLQVYNANSGLRAPDSDSVWGTTLDDDQAWLNSLPFIGHWRGGGYASEDAEVTEDPTIVAAGEQLGNRMPNDLAKDNLGKIANLMSRLPSLVDLATSGRIQPRHVQWIGVVQFVPAKVAADVGIAKDFAATMGMVTGGLNAGATNYYGPEQ